MPVDAAAAAAAGAEVPTLQRIGASGSHPSNAERDLLRLSAKTGGLSIPLHSVECVVLHPERLAPVMGSRPMLLPHELCAHMWNHRREEFHELFGTAGLRSFWENAMRGRHEVFLEHPIRAEIESTGGQYVIPYRLFGDEGAVGQNRSLLVFHWVPLTTTLTETRRTRLPVFTLLNQTSVHDVTSSELYERAAWSFTSMFHGAHPEWPWADGTPKRRALAGTALCGPYKFVFYEVVSDWDYAVKAFHLESHFNTAPGCCHLCSATKGGIRDYMDFSVAALWTAERSRNADYLASRAGRMSPISTIPGFHILACGPELMHAGPLGVLLIAAGCTLYELVCEGYWVGCNDVGVWKVRLALRLGRAYQDFKRWQRRTRKHCSQSKFKVSSLSMSRLRDLPTLKAKAFNCLVVVAWLAELCGAQVPTGNARVQLRALTLWGFNEFFDIVRAAPMWLSDAHIESIKVARDAALYGYGGLAALARASHHNRWVPRPKLHMIDHAFREAAATRRNPGSCWAFQEEDNMGVVIRIASACHGFTIESRTLQRWMLQWGT